MSKTYDQDEVQKVVFTTSSPSQGGGQGAPPPDTYQVPIDEQEAGDPNGEDQQNQDQLYQEAQELLEGMEPKGTVSCGSVETSKDKQEDDLGMLDSIEADEAIKQIEDEVAEKGGDHPFKSSQPGTGTGGSEYEIEIQEVRKMPRWVKLIKKFAEKEFEKVRGKKEFDAPFSFAYGFVQRSKVKSVKFKKHMYIMADVSGSMMWNVGGKGDTLVEQLLAFIPKLTEDYTAELWFVSSGLLKKSDGKDAIYTPRELMDLNPQSFAKWLKKVSTEVPMGGGTSFSGPFKKLLEKRKEDDNEGVVIVLTDTDFQIKVIPTNTIIVTDNQNKPTLDNRYSQELLDEKLNFHIIDYQIDS